MKNKNFLEFMAQKNVPVATDAGTEQRDSGKPPELKEGDLIKTLKEVLELAKNAVERYERSQVEKEGEGGMASVVSRPSADLSKDLFGSKD